MKQNKNKPNRYLVIAGIIAVLLAGIGIYYLAKPKPDTLNLDEFAKCITSKGYAMAGTEWCPHCQNQKKRFGSSFQYINFKDCDVDTAWCASKGIEGYPTWVGPDSKLYSGEKELTELAELTGCTLPG